MVGSATHHSYRNRTHPLAPATGSFRRQSREAQIVRWAHGDVLRTCSPAFADPCLADRGKNTHLSQHAGHIKIDLLAQKSIAVELENSDYWKLEAASGWWDTRPFAVMGSRDAP